ncbi:MAG TPA: S9 family peptidase [Candidatus Krumholzibacteria bacterium]|nr:S9 family peptidase [Candidatus Krumholzibacteria bacterium]
MILPISVTSVAQAADTHPFGVRDMWEMKRISDPQVSPDGKWVLFTLRTTDFDANRGRTDLWVVGVDGKGLRQLTNDPSADTGGRWSVDGKSIFFTSTRSKSSQIWKLPFGGGEATQVTKLPLDVSNIVTSPDGKWLAFSAEVFPGTSIDETAKKLEERAASKATGQVYDSLFIRHWDTWKDGRRNHVFVMPVDGGAPVDVMKAMDADAPSKPFGGAEEFTFTPDSRAIMFSARAVGREEAWSTNFDLFLAPIDGSAAPRNLTADNQAWDTVPAFSPDGKQLAWLAMSRPGYEADRKRVMVRAWPDGAAREIAPRWDRSAETIVWSRDGKTIYTYATNVGNQSLFALDVAKGRATTIVREGWVNSIAGLAGKSVVYGLDHLRSPVEIYAATLDGKNIKQVTRINAPEIAAARWGETEHFTFRGADNDTVYAWMVKPVDFDAKKKYPVALIIHGGPQVSMSNHFHYRWNPQFYAGAGYAAVVVDFHGSPGYGQAFCDAIRGDWGGKPFEDLQKGLDAALAKYPFMDGANVVALGASFGGYMVNWMAGQMPDRFRAFVCHDGNLDERFAYFDTEELWFPEWEHHGTPWENPEGYAKHNPIDHVGKWKTPMLVIHGGKDYRVVETQGFATFNVLQRRGIPSKFLYFPTENHWVLSPANSIQWHTEVLAWIDRWAKPSPN